MRKLLIGIAVVGFMLTGPVAAHASTNDDFANAIDISSSLPYSVTGDNTLDTRQIGEPDGCVPTGATEWFKMTSPAGGMFAADTANSSFDTVLSVFTGNSVDALTEIACNDDVSHYPAWVTTSSLAFRVQAGQTVFIRLGGYDNQPQGVSLPLPEVPGPSPLAKQGSYELHVAEIHPPANDDFANATELTSLPFTDTVSLVDATVEPNEPTTNCFAPFADRYSHTVWYHYVANARRTLLVRASSPDSTGVITAYEGSDLGSLNFLGCNFSQPRDSNSLSVSVNPGDSIYLQATNVYGPPGTLDISVDGGSASPPANDDFANATDVSSFPFTDTVDTTNATLQSGEPASSCGPATGNTVWYKVSLRKGEGFSFSVDSSQNFIAALYSGSSLQSLNLVSCLGYGTVQAPDTGTYYVQLGGWDQGDGTVSSGVYSLTLDEIPQADVGITAITVKNLPLQTDAADVPTGTHRTVSVTITNFGPDDQPDSALLNVSACPVTDGVCDTLDSYDSVHLKAGETVTMNYDWHPLGVGDYQIEAGLRGSAYDSNPQNDSMQSSAYSVVGGTGVGVAPGCAVVICV